MKLLILMGVGATIGYVTNYIAIKLLFKPYKPVKLGNLTIFPQGVIPREKGNLAKKVGEVVRDYILSEEEIRKIVTSPEVKSELENFLNGKIEELLERDVKELAGDTFVEKIAGYIEKFVQEKFPMFATFVNRDLIKDVLLKADFSLKLNSFVSKEKTKELLLTQIYDFLEKEVPQIFLKAHIDKIVEEKVASFDEKTLEDMLFALMKKHFGFINLAGAVLGALIGAVQYFVI